MPLSPFLEDFTDYSPQNRHPSWDRATSFDEECVACGINRGSHQTIGYGPTRCPVIDEVTGNATLGAFRADLFFVPREGAESMVLPGAYIADPELELRDVPLDFVTTGECGSRSPDLHRWYCERPPGHEGPHSAFDRPNAGRPSVFWPQEPAVPPFSFDDFATSGLANRPLVTDPFGYTFPNRPSLRCTVTSQHYVNSGIIVPHGHRCDLVDNHPGTHVMNLGAYSFGVPTEFDGSSLVRNPYTIGARFSVRGQYREAYCWRCSVRHIGTDENMELDASFRDEEGDPFEFIDAGNGDGDWCPEEEGRNVLECFECSAIIIECNHEVMCPCGDGCAEGDCDSCRDNDDYYEDEDYESGCSCEACHAIAAWAPGQDEQYVSELTEGNA